MGKDNKKFNKVSKAKRQNWEQAGRRSRGECVECGLFGRHTFSCKIGGYRAQAEKG